MLIGLVGHHSIVCSLQLAYYGYNLQLHRQISKQVEQIWNSYQSFEQVFPCFRNIGHLWSRLNFDHSIFHSQREIFFVNMFCSWQTSPQKWLCLPSDIILHALVIFELQSPRQSLFLSMRFLRRRKLFCHLIIHLIRCAIQFVVATVLSAQPTQYPFALCLIRDTFWYWHLAGFKLCCTQILPCKPCHKASVLYVDSYYNPSNRPGARLSVYADKYSFNTLNANGANICIFLC